MNKDAKGILILIAALVAISLMSSCKDRPNEQLHYDKQGILLPPADSAKYMLYRSHRVNFSADLQPVYIPVEDSVFHPGDTIGCTTQGAYNPESNYRVVLDRYVKRIKLPKEE